MMPCSLVGGYRRFRRTCCLHVLQAAGASGMLVTTRCHKQKDHNRNGVQLQHFYEPRNLVDNIDEMVYISTAVCPEVRTQ
jgi:hypothetical protein